MTFFFASRTTAQPSSSTRGHLRLAVSLVAMTAVFGLTAAPAAAAEATTGSSPLSASILAAGLEPQRAIIHAAPAPYVEVDEYEAEAAVAAVVAPVAGGIRWPYPFEARVNDSFGPRSAPCSGCSSFHDGLDLGGGDGTPIQSIADGVVVTATNDAGGLGTHVEIQHVVDGRVITSSYSHMQYGSLGMAVGQVVTAGQFIGLTGTTGQSTGPHLHLELFYEDGVRIDPAAWLQANAVM